MRPVRQALELAKPADQCAEQFVHMSAPSLILTWTNHGSITPADIRIIKSGKISIVELVAAADSPRHLILEIGPAVHERLLGIDAGLLNALHSIGHLADDDVLTTATVASQSAADRLNRYLHTAAAADRASCDGHAIVICRVRADILLLHHSSRHRPIGLVARFLVI